MGQALGCGSAMLEGCVRTAVLWSSELCRTAPADSGGCMLLRAGSAAGGTARLALEGPGQGSGRSSSSGGGSIARRAGLGEQRLVLTTVGPLASGTCPTWQPLNCAYRMPSKCSRGTSGRGCHTACAAAGPQLPITCRRLLPACVTHAVAEVGIARPGHEQSNRTPV
jgi:hypothetical protein